MFTAGCSVTTTLQLLKEEDVTVMKRKDSVSSDKQIYEPIGGHLQSITISNLIIILVCQTAHLKFSFEPKFKPIKDIATPLSSSTW